MYLARTPEFIQGLFPNFVWRIPTEEKKIFLTFDDGPIPESTPWILKELEKHNAEATFFCVGDNIIKHPHLFHQMMKGNFGLGSHTFNHLSGWGTENIQYFHNVRRGATLIKSAMFRPPYGRLRPSQVPFLMRHYYIVMWDVLSGDFDPKISAQQCLDNVMENAAPGSIIVFHDSLKSFDKLQYVLPEVLKHLSADGYRFESLTEDLLCTFTSLRKSA